MAQINRANFAANLNTTTAWTGGVVPTATDIAAWGTPNITTGLRRLLAVLSLGRAFFFNPRRRQISASEQLLLPQ